MRRLWGLLFCWRCPKTQFCIDRLNERNFYYLFERQCLSKQVCSGCRTCSSCRGCDRTVLANEVQGDRKGRPYYIRTGCAFLGVEGCVMAILAPDGWENPDGFPSGFIAVVALVAVVAAVIGLCWRMSASGCLQPDTAQLWCICA